MWGLKGKEDVIIIFYNVIINVLGNKYLNTRKCQTTQYNFISKYISLEDLRNDKIGQILGK